MSDVDRITAEALVKLHAMSSGELSLSIDEFSRRYIEPAAATIADRIGRIARAIYTAEARRRGLRRPWEGLPTAVRRDYVHTARAVFDAMRNPPPEPAATNGAVQ